MSISELFIRGPIATTLLTIAMALAGAAAFRLLPVSPLPQVDFPTINVAASLPGATPVVYLYFDRLQRWWRHADDTGRGRAMALLPPGS